MSKTNDEIEGTLGVHHKTMKGQQEVIEDLLLAVAAAQNQGR